MLQNLEEQERMWKEKNIKREMGGKKRGLENRIKYVFALRRKKKATAFQQIFRFSKVLNFKKKKTALRKY